MKREKEVGITLVALVVTIVVLLILAGITIAYILGDNGVFQKAQDAALNTKLAEIEEDGGIIYNNLLTQKYVNNSNNNITTESIVTELIKQGYEIKQVTLTPSTVTGISAEDIVLAVNEEKEITVKLDGLEGGNAYYAVVQGRYYKIELKDGGLTVNRIAEEIKETLETDTNNLTATSDNPNIIATVEDPKGTIIKIKASTTVDNATITIKYGKLETTCTVSVVIRPSLNSKEDIEGVDFSTEYGKIDIIWLEGTSNIPSNPQKPNSPEKALTANGESLKPVCWDDAGVKELERTTNENNEWYNYTMAEDKQDSKLSCWANARTNNENLSSDDEKSYFVWIPRYAYRITYYDKDYKIYQDAKITGYYDGYGMWDASTGKLKCKLETKIDNDGNEIKDENGKTIPLVETVEYNGDLYIVHPAFTDKIDMGGWTEPLEGFWFAKFKMSGNGNTNKSLKSSPGSAIYTSQLIRTFYTNARQATYGYNGVEDSDGNTSFMNSHMCKNSEWGAVAYLTHSQYGRNGYAITYNGNSYAGGSNKTTDYIKNSNQSSTGNSYGVYDMRSKIAEETASWNTLATSYLENR